MDNSDDYFEDDIVFDDEAFAALDAEESKFIASQAQATSTQRPPPLHHPRYVPPQPPAKRQKTASGWRAPVQVQQRPAVAPGPTAYSLEDLDLPEISVRDGFYGVQRDSSQDLVHRAIGGGNAGAGGGMKRPASSMSNSSSGNIQQAAGSGSRTASGGSNASGPTSKPATLQRTRSGLQVIGSYIPQAPTHPPPRYTANQNHNPTSSRQPLPFVNAYPPQNYNQHPQPQHPHNQQQERPTIGRVTSFSGSGGSGSGPRLSQGLARQISNPSFNNRATPVQQHARRASVVIIPEPPSAPNQDEGARKMEEELAELRAQFEALQRSNEEMQTTLKEALNAKRAKAGEVIILRENMEKANQTHIAEQVKLRAAKEAAEAVQLQIQRDMKEELERLKTQFTFKQHELETSTVRKTPWNASTGNRLTQGPGPSTPTQVPLSSQMRRWDQSEVKPRALHNLQNAVAGPSGLANIGRKPDSPPRPKFGNVAPDSPHRRSKKLAAQPPALSAKKRPVLPGFENAFLPSPERRRNPEPSQSTVASPLRGKEKERETVQERPQPPILPPSRARLAVAAAMAAAHAPSQRDVNDVQPLGTMQPSPPSSPARPSARSQQIAELRREMDEEADGGDDVMMDAELDMSFGMDISTPTQSQEEEEIAKMDPPDWVAHLNQIIFTHSVPGSRSNTFQTLLSVTSSLNDDAAAYSSASVTILETMGSASRGSSLEPLYRTVSTAFVQMAAILLRQEQTSPLAALLSVLSTCTVFLPSFIISLLDPTDPEPEYDAPMIFTTICQTVSTHLPPVQTKTDSQNVDKKHVTDLPKAVLGFLDAVCWSLPPAFEHLLSVVIKSPGTLSTLLDPSQPTWFLEQSTRLVALLATRTSLYSDFLALPEGAGEQSNRQSRSEHSQAGNRLRIPQVESLCALLTDSKHVGSEADSMRASILSTFTLLGLAHADGLAVLNESHSVILSLISFLTILTVPLWEEDPTLMRSPSLIKSAFITILISTVGLIKHALILLNYLVFAPDPNVNLALRLHQASHRQFNGISHMFVVTLGRLTYAEPPDEVGDEEKVVLEQIADLARDLMDLVVGGPESESVWATYQDGEEGTEEGSVIDVDEEMS